MLNNIKKNILFTSHIQIFQIISSIIFIPLFLHKFGIEKYAIYTIAGTLILYISVFESVISVRIVNSNNHKSILNICYFLWVVFTIINYAVLKIIFYKVVDNDELILPLSLMASSIIFNWYVKYKLQIEGSFVFITNFFPLYNIVKLYLCYFFSDNIEYFIVMNLVLSYSLYLPFIKILLPNYFNVNQLLQEVKSSKYIIKMNLYGYTVGNLDKYILAVFTEPSLYGAYMLVNNISSFIRVIPNQINNVFYANKNVKTLKLNLNINLIIVFLSLNAFILPVIFLTNYLNIFEQLHNNFTLFIMMLASYSVNIIYASLMNYEIMRNKEKQIVNIIETGCIFLLPLSLTLIYYYGIYGGAFFSILLNLFYLITYMIYGNNNRNTKLQKNR